MKQDIRTITKFAHYGGNAIRNNIKFETVFLGHIRNTISN